MRWLAAVILFIFGCCLFAFANLYLSPDTNPSHYLSAISGVLVGFGLIALFAPSNN